MKYIIAHDLGTSGNKATLFNENGQLLGMETKEYGVDFFHENWAEQDAQDWWKAVCDTTNNLLGSLKIQAKDVAVVSFSGQMMGCLCVDRKGIPLRKSIIWADQRAKQQSKHLEDKISQWDFYRITGHRNTPSYGILKLMWVKDNQPEIYEKTFKMLNAKDYIVFRLTGNYYTDFSDADSCGCFDINTLSWSEKIIAAAGIDKDKLPDCRPSTFTGGAVTKEAASLTGLKEGTPVILGAGDGVTANVGAGAIKEGKSYCCLGTSAWVTTTAKKPVFDEQMRIVNWPHAVPGLYAPNGTMQAAGASYSWVKNQICKMEQYEAELHSRSPYDYINEEISNSPAGANGVIFLPYLLGERAPRWNSDAKGCFLGLKAENTRNDLLRSVLEGVSMNLALCLDILKSKVNIEEMTVVGGGAKGEVWRQILADIFQLRINVPDILEEAGSMGAAIIGGVGAGIFNDFDAASRFISMNRYHLPDKTKLEKYKELKEIFDEAYYQLEPVFKKMH